MNPIPPTAGTDARDGSVPREVQRAAHEKPKEHNARR